MKIKKGDNVIVISGKDRGKSGKILRLHPATNKILIEGIALAKKHQRPRRSGQKGEIITMPTAINASNVMVICAHCARGVRTQYLVSSQIGAKKTRVCRRCKNEI